LPIQSEFSKGSYTDSTKCANLQLSLCSQELLPNR